jgi:hypothetical protein
MRQMFFSCQYDDESLGMTQVQMATQPNIRPLGMLPPTSLLQSQEGTRLCESNWNVLSLVRKHGQKFV